MIQRIKNLWAWSMWHPKDYWNVQPNPPISNLAIAKAKISKEKATFIMPDRTKEILNKKPGASIDDVLTK